MGYCMLPAYLLPPWLDIFCAEQEQLWWWYFRTPMYGIEMVHQTTWNPIKTLLFSRHDTVDPTATADKTDNILRKMADVMKARLPEVGYLPLGYDNISQTLTTLQTTTNLNWHALRAANLYKWLLSFRVRQYSHKNQPVEYCLGLHWLAPKYFTLIIVVNRPLPPKLPPHFTQWLYTTFPNLGWNSLLFIVPDTTADTLPEKPWLTVLKQQVIQLLWDSFPGQFTAIQTNQPLSEHILRQLELQTVEGWPRILEMASADRKNWRMVTDLSTLYPETNHGYFFWK